MHKIKQPKKGSADQSVRKLLIAEYQNLVQWLHDDLGQNLVAIKSFAEAIIEQNKDSKDDTSELAEFIKQAVGPGVSVWLEYRYDSTRRPTLSCRQDGQFNFTRVVTVILNCPDLAMIDRQFTDIREAATDTFKFAENGWSSSKPKSVRYILLTDDDG